MASIVNLINWLALSLYVPYNEWMNEWMNERVKSEGEEVQEVNTNQRAVGVCPRIWHDCLNLQSTNLFQQRLDLLIESRRRPEKGQYCNYSKYHSFLLLTHTSYKLRVRVLTRWTKHEHAWHSAFCILYSACIYKLQLHYQNSRKSKNVSKHYAVPCMYGTRYGTVRYSTYTYFLRISSSEELASASTYS